jgi:hypothetical protein
MGAIALMATAQAQLLLPFFGCVAEEMPCSPQSTSFASSPLCVDWGAGYKVLLAKNLQSVVLDTSDLGLGSWIRLASPGQSSDDALRLAFQACCASVPIARIGDWWACSRTPKCRDVSCFVQNNEFYRPQRQSGARRSPTHVD